MPKICDANTFYLKTTLVSFYLLKCLQPYSLYTRKQTLRERNLEGLHQERLEARWGVHVNGGSGTAGEENANWCAIECACVMSCISPRGHN